MSRQQARTRLPWDKPGCVSPCRGFSFVRAFWSRSSLTGKRGGQETALLVDQLNMSSRVCRQDQHEYKFSVACIVVIYPNLRCSAIFISPVAARSNRCLNLYLEMWLQCSCCRTTPFQAWLQNLEIQRNNLYGRKKAPCS